MGTVKIIAKYDLNTNKWRKNIKEEEKGKAFSIVDYKKINNNDSDKYDYIIFCDGFRLENHSKNMKTVEESKNGVDKIINYFKDKDKNIKIKTILIDMDAPLEEDSKLLANYINKIEDANTINIVGISKCGAMAFNMAKYINDKDKTNIYTIATPFTGTLMASPRYVKQKLNKIVKSIISDEDISNKIVKSVMRIYENICSNSHMDYDVALKNGVEKSKLNKYDSNFLKNIFSNENIKAINEVNFYQNFTTGIDNETLIEAIQTLNFEGIGLCLLNGLLMGGKTDGFVPLKSEKEVEKYINKKSYHLKSSHHAVFSNDRLAYQILKVINENLKKYNKVI